MNWNEFAQEVHQVAVEKGWWETPHSFDDIICMCICELAEAVEEYRNGRPNYYHLCGPSDGKRLPCVLTTGGDLCEIAQGDPCDHMDPKPQGVAVELADCVLRLLDYMAYRDMVDIDQHLGLVPAPDTLTALVCQCAGHLFRAHHEYSIPKFDSLYWAQVGMCQCLNVIRDWFLCEHIDLEAILRAKHEYNKTRPYRHGGKRL